MNRYGDTNNPKHLPKAALHPHAQSAALWAFVGSLVVFFVLVGVLLVFWTVAHPQPAAQKAAEGVEGTTGYSTEGGHDPLENRRPRNTRDELKFRGELTPPSEARGR